MLILKFTTKTENTLKPIRASVSIAKLQHSVNKTVFIKNAALGFANRRISTMMKGDGGHMSIEDEL